MIDIYLPTVRLELKNNRIYDYLEAMGMKYKFLPYSDFDFILKKKQISELIDYIITTDGSRDVEMVETLAMTLTEMTLNKIKYAEFHIRWEKK